jgi:hypothetical protein
VLLEKVAEDWARDLQEASVGQQDEGGSVEEEVMEKSVADCRVQLLHRGRREQVERRVREFTEYVVGRPCAAATERALGEVRVEQPGALRQHALCRVRKHLARGVHSHGLVYRLVDDVVC